jgi:glycyl-tRNA synthetase beta chain
VLAEILESAMDALPWAKSMRWRNTTVAWVRPLRGILAVYDGEPLPFSYELIRTIAAIKSLPLDQRAVVASNTTVGHRFSKAEPCSVRAEPFSVKDFADYQARLRAAKVVLDPHERRAMIWEGASRLAEAAGLVAKPDEDLLDEVTGLVEWPVPLMGRIDDAYMDLPPEVLTTSMRHHLKFFSCLTKDGALAPKFIVVAATEASDAGKAIVAGNERVLRARLADARFFWDSDRKTRLADRVPRLTDMVFHAKLGTLDAKTDRVEALAGRIAEFVKGANKERVRSAARLAKADLTTGMVGEFPELQGTMGRYYALHDKEHADIADALADHYAPQGPTDRCPSKPISIAVALADKIDTLAGFWSIDERPTGSKDPFALRRAALGVIRLIVENGVRLPLKDVYREAFQLYRVTGTKADQRIDELLDFFADRLKSHLKEKSVRHDLISAVFARRRDDDLVRLLARVQALQNFLASDDGANLLTAYKRAANILKIEEKKDGVSHAGKAERSLLEKPEEKDLSGRLEAAEPEVERAIQAEHFAEAMAALARLRRPVDSFFDHVTVNANDKALRANRLKLLSGIRSALEGVADFSRIEG